MRKSIFAAILIATIAGIMALATPGQAAGTAKYCASANGSHQCMYYTYAECRTAVRGTGADCIRNPRSYQRRN